MKAVIHIYDGNGKLLVEQHFDPKDTYYYHAPAGGFGSIGGGYRFNGFKFQPLVTYEPQADDSARVTRRS